MKNKRYSFLGTGEPPLQPVYVVLTLVFAPLSFGEVQIRFPEALTVLPFFSHRSPSGTVRGCIIANLWRCDSS